MKTAQTKKVILYILIAVVVLAVAGMATVYIFKQVTEQITAQITEEIVAKETARITQEQVGKITQQKTEQITDEVTKAQIEQMTKEITAQKTKEIMEVKCDLTPRQRQFSSPSYYTGPLIDAHLHMPFTFDVPKALYAQADHGGAVLEKEVAAGSIMCVFDKTGVTSALGFYVIPSLLKGQAVVQIKQIDEKFPGRITPFIMTAHVTTLNLQPADVESVLQANPGLFKGIGEIALYKPAYKGISPDDAMLLPFYEIADKYGLVVMMHPDDGQRAAVENILQKYPTVKFLFHGEYIGIYVTEIVAAYPNAYYSIDTDFSDIPWERQSVNLYSDRTKEEFVVDFKRDYDKILATAITSWKSPIEQNPDKFMWGTDRAAPMHFEEEVGALLDEITRAFIGQLDPTVQEKFAHENAEKLFEGKK